MKIVEEEWLREKITEEDALEAVKIAFTALGEKKVAQPPVQQLQFFGHGETCIKSAYLLGRPYATVKVASGFYQNIDKGLPSGSGLMMVLDAKTGFPSAILQDGGFLTDLRTAGAGALAVDLLVPRRSLKKIAIIGSGIQARFQLRAISKVRGWECVEAYSPNTEHVIAYCREMEEEFRRPVSVAPSAMACVRNADLIITTTPAKGGIVQAAWVAPGSTIIAMGSDTPGKQELAVDVLEQASKHGKIICDSVAQCKVLGEVQHATHLPVAGELGDVLLGRVPGRERDDQIIICDLTGCGAQDAAIADKALSKYLEACK